MWVCVCVVPRFVVVIFITLLLSHLLACQFESYTVIYSFVWMSGRAYDRAHSTARHSLQVPSVPLYRWQTHGICFFQQKKMCYENCYDFILSNRCDLSFGSRNAFDLLDEWQQQQQQQRILVATVVITSTNIMITVYRYKFFVRLKENSINKLWFGRFFLQSVQLFSGVFPSIKFFKLILWYSLLCFLIFLLLISFVFIINELWQLNLRKVLKR